MRREDWKELAGVFLTTWGLIFSYSTLEALNVNLLLGLFFSLLAGVCSVEGISAWIDARIEKKLKKAR